MTDKVSLASRLSILFPTSPAVIDPMVPFARLVKETGAARLWMGQSLRVEPHQAFASLAGSGMRLPFGTAVTLAPLRHPYEAAIQARSVAQLSGQPYVAGFGAGAPRFAASLLGKPYSRPKSAMVDYLRSVRALLDGEVVRHQGEFHSLNGGLIPLDHPKVEVAAGVLRASMARGVGEVADAAITWLAPHGYIKDVLRPACLEGASERDVAPRIISMTHVIVHRSGRELDEIAFAATGTHLSAPHYVDMLNRAGIPVDSSNPRAGAAMLLDREVIITGTADEIAAELSRQLSSGIDEIVLNCAGIFFTEGIVPAVQDLIDIMQAVRRLPQDEVYSSATSAGTS